MKDQSSHSQPRVAIVIASKNRAALLSQVLPKSLEQDYPNLEIHLFDDGSDDGTREMIQRDFPRVFYHRNEESIGFVRTRSLAGQILTDCDYLISLDDDSWFLHRDAVSRTVAFFAKFPDTALITYEIFSHWSRPLDPDPASDGKEIAIFVGCGFAVERRRFVELGCFSDFFEGYVEESDLAMRIVDSQWKCRFASTIPVYHDETIMGRDRRKIVSYSVANSMLMYFVREPLWLAPFHCVKTFLQNLRIAIPRGQSMYVISGLGMFFRRSALILRHRKPVKWSALKRYWRLHSEWNVYFAQRLKSKEPRMKIERLTVVASPSGVIPK